MSFRLTLGLLVTAAFASFTYAIWYRIAWHSSPWWVRRLARWLHPQRKTAVVLRVVPTQRQHLASATGR